MHGMSTLLIAALAAAASAGTAMTQMDQVASHVLASQGWASAGELPAKQELTLEIGLTLQNEDQMIEKLLDVSNPKSPNYAKWLDREAANALVQPEKEANDAVMAWLAQEGVTKAVSDGTWVTFKTDLETANRILAADFRRYRRNGISKIRTTSYSVPQEIAKHIDLIHPTTFFGKTAAYRPVLRNRRVRRQSPEPGPEPDPGPEPEPVPTVATIPIPSGLRNAKPTATPYFQVNPGCNSGVTPVCMKQMYNIGNYTPSASSGSRISFGSFLNQSSQYEDVAMYEDEFLLPRQNVTKIFVNNATNCQTPDCAESLAGEANMDAQLMVGVAHPLPVVEYMTGGSPPFIPDLEMPTPDKNTNEPYVPFYQYLLRLSNDEIPQVISNSYGEPEQTVPPNYARRTCSMVALLGLRGVTILESSGDTGIGSYCRTNDADKKPRFLAEFPSSCPWITSVGGTEAVSPEIAWSDSSGGFSDYFAQPAYQSDAVSTYLTRYISAATLSYYSPLFNPKGRGFPDISAHSSAPSFAVITGRDIEPSGGTSASAPVVGAIIGLLNDARLRAGQPSMGFINPWLYQMGSQAVVDIVGGASRGCDGVNHQTGKMVAGAAKIPWAAWNATVGWDPVTGLGVPDFQKMLQAAIQRPNGFSSKARVEEED